MYLKSTSKVITSSHEEGCDSAENRIHVVPDLGTPVARRRVLRDTKRPERKLRARIVFNGSPALGWAGGRVYHGHLGNRTVSLSG